MRPHEQIRIDVRSTVQVDDAEAVHEPADHVHDGRELHHRDRPYAGHDERHSRGPALPDVVAVDLAFGLRLTGRVEVHLRRGGELRIRRAEAPRSRESEIDEPGPGDVERPFWPPPGEARGRKPP